VIFENQHSALSSQHSAVRGTGFTWIEIVRLAVKPLAHDDSLWRGEFSAARLSCVATLCRPNSKNQKTEPKLRLIVTLKNGEKEHRPLGDRSVELHFSFCYEQNAYGGWVCG
jgi:hypothetical protein